MTPGVSFRRAFPIVLAAFLSTTTWGQDVRQIFIGQQTYQIFDLTPGTPSQVFSFRVGQSTSLMVDVSSRTAAVDVEILTPSGSRVDPNSLERFGVAAADVPPLGAALLEEGFHAQVEIPSPSAGIWTVRASLRPGSSPTAGSIGVFITGGLSVGIVTSRPSYQANDIAVLALAAFRDKVPATGVIASARLATSATDPSPRVVSLVDDGQTPDAQPGDGIYSAGIAGLAPGHYLVTATAQLAGEEAIAATNFDVTIPLAKLSGSKTDRGLDTNGDGLFEWIAVDVGVSVDTEGSYEVLGSLRSSVTAKELPAATRDTLKAGLQSIRLRFPADVIRSVLGTNGPWEIFNVRLVHIGNGLSRDVSTDRSEDLGSTAPYSLSQLQRPVTLILESMTERAIDTNSNGLFDLVQTTFRVDTLRAGSYTWTGTLRSLEGAPLSVASGEGVLAAGTTTLGFTFDAKPIGASGIDGPYGLFDVAVYGPPGGAALRPEVGRTQPYKASQFEGSQVTFDRLIELLSTIIIGGRGGVPVTSGIRNSFVQKLEAARNQASNGRVQAALGILGAFVNEFRALTPARVSQGDSDVIVEFANRLRTRLANP
ncbi:MAG: hypothetical protein HOP16_15410 [Acidobacteria bacterium]|nr:hypothetical protein [Acidobacteriota bacterium]